LDSDPRLRPETDIPAAHRDRAMFRNADKVIIGRKRNTRAAFGLCVRRCIGFNLARMETPVAAEEWL
jgi:cytochrome P450